MSSINTLKLRATLGWLGMCLPWIVLVLSVIFGYGIPDSISATYYLFPTITPFMIILGSAGILLVNYNGYDKQDAFVCSIAGILGISICLFPCGTEDLVAYWTNVYIPAKVGTFQLPQNISGVIHNISALGFFGLLAYNSFFLFTKSSGEMTRKKQKRNIIYRVCGVGMLASFLLMIPVTIFNVWGGVWAVETVALTFFGISWLTKSDIYPWLFCDTPYTD